MTCPYRVASAGPCARAFSMITGPGHASHRSDRSARGGAGPHGRAEEAKQAA